MTTKPILTKSISANEFKNFYWLKSELIDFCSQHNLSTNGSKHELSERVGLFLESGKIIKPTLKQSSSNRDSAYPIERHTLVVNYKNDAKTREFFIAQIGSHFHFNSYLRQFTNAVNVTAGLTYGDLVDGWISEEAKKNDSGFKTSIGEQFEYNRFIRDFFANESGKTLADGIKAWKVVSSVEGPNTYSFFRKLSINK